MNKNKKCMCQHCVEKRENGKNFGGKIIWSRKTKRGLMKEIILATLLFTSFPMAAMKEEEEMKAWLRQN